jgi:hypothetical protein
MHDNESALLLAEIDEWANTAENSALNWMV